MLKGQRYLTLFFMKKIIKILSGLLVVIAVLSIIVWLSNQNQDLKVYFFDVGQGDAILIRTPGGQNVVIDGGPDNTFIIKLGKTLPFYDRTIDLMVLTHPHDDHLFGLVEVLKRYQVKQVLYSGVSHTTDAYLEWLSIIKEKKIPLTIALAGQTFVFNNVRLKIIFPLENLANKEMENLNDASVVAQLIYGQTKMLFMGDLEENGEEQILQFFAPDIKSQVIKIGHHGSDTSSSQNFLKAVNPDFAVISVGLDNKFNHPSLRILARLNNEKAKIFQTRNQGDIVLRSNGQKIAITSGKP